MLVSELQSWGKCNACGDILWVEPSPDEQRCGCRCGNLQLHNGVATGETDPAFTDTDMQLLLDTE